VNITNIKPKQVQKYLQNTKIKKPGE